ncbi:MAG TPA: NUDIX hydrolase [Longimicrobiales bacterium]|nr:NUDIX hydrolase [Longimicrobiales bacterium]
MAKRAGSRGERRGARRPVRLETSAGGVVYRHSGGTTYYLLIRDPYENWGLPKGHVEKGETPAETALREVREETGIEALALREPLKTIDWFFREGADLIHKYCHFFLMETPVEDTRPQVEEGITECVWLPLDAALRTMTYDNARQVLEAAGHRVRALQNGA